MPDDAGIVIVSAGGHARVVGEAIGAGRLRGHVAPAPGDDPLLGPWLGDDRAAPELAAAGHRFAMGIGFVDRPGSQHRGSILDTWARWPLVSVTHPTAIVSVSAVLGPGSFVAAGAIIGTGVELGEGSIVNTGAVVDHDGRIGRNAHIGPGAVLSGHVGVGPGTLVGVGATVRQGVRIGRSVVIGAGAVVVGDVADGATALGVPARSTTPESGR